MDSLALIKRLLAQREFKVDLAPGLSVTVRRPAEAELPEYLRQVRAGNVDAHLACVVGWQGFSEATLFGAAIGSSDPLPFDAEAWLTAARDRSEWATTVAEKLGESIVAHAQQREATAKNSMPSSTRKAALSGRAKPGR